MPAADDHGRGKTPHAIAAVLTLLLTLPWK